MSSDFPPNQDDRLELEASLSALLLGELPDGQAAALRERIAIDPELAKLYDRLKATIHLVQETSASPETAGAPLHLSAERREKLFAQFKTVAPREFVRRKSLVSRPFRVAGLAAIAALLAIAIRTLIVPRREQFVHNGPVQRLASDTRSRFSERSGKPSQAVTVDPDTRKPVSTNHVVVSQTATNDARLFYSTASPARELDQDPKAEDKSRASGAYYKIVLPPSNETSEAVALAKSLAPSASPNSTPALSEKLDVNGDKSAVGGRAFSVALGNQVTEPGQVEVSNTFAFAGGAASPSVGALGVTTGSQASSSGKIVLPWLSAASEAEPGGKSGAQVASNGAPLVSDPEPIGVLNDPEQATAGIKAGIKFQAGSVENTFQNPQIAPPQDTKSSTPPNSQAATPFTVDPDTRKLVVITDSGVTTFDATNGIDAWMGMWMGHDMFTATEEARRLAESAKPIDDEARLLKRAKEGTLTDADRKALEDIADQRSAEALKRQNELARDGLRDVEKSWDVPLAKPEIATESGRLAAAQAAAEANRTEPQRLLGRADQQKAGEDETKKALGLSEDQFAKSAIAPSLKQPSAATPDASGIIALPAGASSNDLALKDKDLLLTLWKKLPASGIESKVKPELQQAQSMSQGAVAVQGSSFGNSGDMPAVRRHLEVASDEGKAATFGLTTNSVALADNKDRLKTQLGDDDTGIRRPISPALGPQPEVRTADNAFSTFSMNVSDVSWKLAAASLEQGRMPDAVTVRSEEFLNAFDYRDPQPAAGVPVGFAWERAQDPFEQNRDLLRFSIRTAAEGRQKGCPMNIVLLLDNSGSMERADRVRIVHEALRVLASQLQPGDKLSVVLFARTARLLADGVPGDQAAQVAREVSGLTPQGGTNLEEAMNLAYQTASRHYLARGVNRVVLFTDGAANLGSVDPEALRQKVEANRKQGIALDCFGVGWEGYNDDLLETLSSHGDGRYAFLNTPEDAATDFAAKLAGALHVAAADCKVQVEFNPRRVTAYRQVGYAKFQLTKQQFRDNTVDAAEIGAAESGNALYVVQVNPNGEGPLATVRVRYRVPGTDQYPEHSWDVPYNGTASPLARSTPTMRLAAVVGAFSEWLVFSPPASEATPDKFLALLSGVPEAYGADERPKKLEWMIRQAKSISGR